MPLIKEDTDKKAVEPSGQEKVETVITVTEPAPDDIDDVIARIAQILKFLNVEYLDVRKDRIYYRYLPDRTAEEAEKLIDWYMEEIKKG